MQTTQENAKLENIIDVITFCKENSLSADIVGSWVWLRFDEKPSEEIRNKIKAAGFRWCKNRGEWAHSCGKPSRRGRIAPRLKYGSIAIDAN